jgi:class 3 adenylate cyclase/AmiR/NasT family two-component response regulator
MLQTEDLSILIVDDTPANLRILSQVFDEHGYRVRIANSGKRALEAIESNPPDLILLDIMMPELSGYEVCKELKSRPHTREIPVIFISALDAAEDKVNAFAAGGVDYVTKPFHFEEVLARVRTHLSIRALQKRLEIKNRQLEEEISERKRIEEKLVEYAADLQVEKRKSDQLLLNILPSSVANDLKETGQTVPQVYPEVTAFFSDIVGFTKISSELEPARLIELLNEMFTAFDRIMEKHACERIKTSGDAYLAVCGMPESNPDHAENMVRAAQEAIRFLIDAKLPWQVRIGIHSGAVVGGVVGVQKYIYDVFGDTINTAARMETYSEPMRINISEATYRRLKNPFQVSEREITQVRGKGNLRMYFVEI